MRKIHFLPILAILGTGCGGGKHTEAGAGDCTPGTPNCSLVAPPLDRTVTTNVYNATQFLYSGANPLQKGVAAGTIDPKRAAVIRGKLTDASGAPLAGVKISVVGHDELGWTLTRTDGLFDLVVNGGQQLTFSYAKDGFLVAQRSLSPAWLHYVNAPEVGLVALVGKATAITAASGTQQTATAEAVSDQYGKRQPLVLFAPGTTADAQLPDGSTQPLSTLSVHVTEYPLETSPKATPRFAPGTLSRTGNVNYTVEFTVDEAEALGATSVHFSQPATVYVENFLGIAPGAAVPLGYYNRGSSRWEGGAQSGRVVQIVDESNGQATLDIDGDGKADTGRTLSDLGVTQDELTELASRYSVGQSLWRTQVSHFSAWDFLFPVAPPSNAVSPAVSPSVRPIDDPSRRGPVLVEKQAVGQTVGIAGTPFSLHYQTDRTARFKSGFEINVPLVGKTIPSGLKQVITFIWIAGQEFDQTFDPQKNLTQILDWNGQDGFGRTMQGRQLAHVSVGYVFPGTISTSSVFGMPGQKVVSPDPTTGEQEATIWQDFEVPVGAFDASAFELGGFSLDALHAYDPVNQTIYFGNGLERTGQNVALSITHYAGDSDLGTPVNLFAAPDGSVLVTDNQAGDNSASGRVLSIAPDQTVSVLAGTGGPGAAGSSFLGSPQGVVMSSDGSVVYEPRRKACDPGVRSDEPRGRCAPQHRGEPCRPNGHQHERDRQHREESDRREGFRRGSTRRARSGDAGRARARQRRCERLPRADESELEVRQRVQRGNEGSARRRGCEADARDSVARQERPMVRAFFDVHPPCLAFRALQVVWLRCKAFEVEQGRTQITFKSGLVVKAMHGTHDRASQFVGRFQSNVNAIFSPVSVCAYQPCRRYRSNVVGPDVLVLVRLMLKARGGKE